MKIIIKYYKIQLLILLYFKSNKKVNKMPISKLKIYNVYFQGTSKLSIKLTATKQKKTLLFCLKIQNTLNFLMMKSN